MIRRLLVVAVALLATVAVMPAAEAGVPSVLNVTKEVVGPVPAGTMFEVQVDCSTDTNDTTLMFGETGGTQSVFLPPSQQCTVTETVDGGADSVAYACTADIQPQLGTVTCVNDQTVDFDIEVGFGEATVTVTNTFSEPTPPAPPPDPPTPTVVTPSGVVAGTPTFTG